MTGRDQNVTDEQRERFAAFLVDFLRDQQISQKELERRSDYKIPYRTIRAWVTARNLPSRDSLPLLADALQLPLETLMKQAGMVEGGDDGDPDGEALRRMAQQIIKYRKDIDRQAWDLFVTMLEEMSRLARVVQKTSEKYQHPEETLIIAVGTRPGARKRKECPPPASEAARRQP